MSSSRALRLDIRSRLVPIALLAASGLALLAGCSADATPAPSGAASGAPEALRVVATTTVLADLVAQVGGSEVVVTSLVPKGGDVHTFDPTPSVLKAAVDAQLVVSNGLGLDDWVNGVISDAGATAPVVVLGEDLAGVTYQEGEAADGQTANPHLWMDVSITRRYVERIRDALITADPADEAAFRAGATAYDATLVELDGWIRDQIATVPEDHRRWSRSTTPSRTTRPPTG